MSSIRWLSKPLSTLTFFFSTYYSGDPTDSDPKRTEYTYDRLDPVAEYYRWSEQRKNLYRTTMAPVTNQMQPSDPLHSQFRPNVGARQGTDLAFYQDFKSETTKKGTLYWYHYDGQGNIAGTTKHQAESDHAYRYDEFGTILPEEGAAGWKPPHNDYTLEQKQYDANEDLFYYGSRFYDAQTGTWMNQDSYRGQLNDPRTLHRYQYEFNRPINLIDLYGFDSPDAANQSAQYYVYGGFDKVTNELRYIGITCRDVLVRANEHLRSGDIAKQLNYERLHQVKDLLTAKGSEQTYLDTYRLAKDGGQLVNKINSIAPTNPTLDQAKQQAQAVQAVPQNVPLWSSILAGITTVGKVAVQVGVSIINAVTSPLLLFVTPEGGYNFPYNSNNPQQRA